MGTHKVRKMATETQPKDFMAQFQSFLDKIPLMQQLEEKTSIDKKALGGGLVGVLLLVVVFGWGSSMLSLLVGFIYPAFSSFKALEEGVHDRIKFWLIYWVVYACFSVVETFLEPILYFVPFYIAIKLAFLVWLYYPATKGAETLYKGVLRDLIKPYVEAIDEKLDDVNNGLQGLAQKATGGMAAMVGEGVALAGQEDKKTE